MGVFTNKYGDAPSVFSWILIAAAVVALVWLFAFNGIQTGSGQHTGYVTATECGGIVFKTCEVYFKTDTQSTQEDVYCVSDKELIEELNSYASSKERVTLHYKQHLGWPGGCIFTNSELVTSANKAT